MKKGLLISMFVFVIVIMLNGQTNGVLTVSTTTSSTGGTYAPKNIVAIWIENNTGNFVKTLLCYAQTRITHLNTWEASTTAAGSTYNTLDAITGATQSNHATRTCSWNGKDFNGNVVSDGTYRLRIELTDKNSTGNISTFSFIKGINTDNQTPSNVPSFSSISIKWAPSISNLNEIVSDENFKIFPNPTTDKFKIIGNNIIEVEIRNIFGELIDLNSSPLVDLSNQPKGIYLIKVKTDKAIITKKIIKQ